MAYFKYQPNRVWSSTSGTEETRQWYMDFSGFGGPIRFMLAVNLNRNSASSLYIKVIGNSGMLDYTIDVDIVPEISSVAVDEIRKAKSRKKVDWLIDVIDKSLEKVEAYKFPKRK